MRANRSTTKAQGRRASSSHSRQMLLPVAAVAASNTVEGQVYKQLREYCKLDTSLELMLSGAKGNGLCCIKAAKKGQVLMRVPKTLALVIDYQSEEQLQLPEGNWPRLRQGVNHEEPLTWDLLFALALMDGLAGDGGTFWNAWCQAVLPPPESLTIPVCWSADQLAELQHPAIAEAAIAQQERLQSMFPSLSEPIGPGMCSWLAWAFACVRSRAFKLGPDCFAFVPFLDLANHSQTPNADFRLQGGNFELFAVQDIQQGDEVCISYTGPEEYTNQRMQAQYGFVISGGNSADRITFELPAADAQQGQQATGLLLSKLQSRLGDNLFAEAVTGRKPRLWAALKSLPWQMQDESELEALESQQDNITGADSLNIAGSSKTSHPKEPSVQVSEEDNGHLELANNLLKQCKQQLEGCETNLVADELELRSLLSAEETGKANPHKLAALLYRIERKELLNNCKILLDLYSRV